MAPTRPSVVWHLATSLALFPTLSLPLCALFKTHWLACFYSNPSNVFSPQALVPCFSSTWTFFPQMSSWLFFFPFSLDLYSLSQCRIKSIILHASTLYINATIFCFSSSFLKFILEIHPGCYIYLCIIHFIYCMYSIWQGQQHWFISSPMDGCLSCSQVFLYHRRCFSD